MIGRDDTVHLTETECWTLLSSQTVARLAVNVGSHPDIFPINYLVHDGGLVFRSGAGTKLAAAVLGRHVAIEIDGFDDSDRSVWSVVVKGEASEIDTMAERFAADDLPLYPWIASPKPNFVRIEPTSVTGRRFHVVDDVRVHGVPAEGEGVATESPGEYHPGAPQLRPD
jgi:nitroimidazol reductase NimA-like FMN-containing flavoprotein (pyridoxamine 5'-phosphate oxidase superfamily)